MRYEKKFLVALDLQYLIDGYLIDNKFISHYPSRIVNSIYYDSYCFSRYNESEDGISKRSKCRIRFYNSDIENLVLEYKSKNSELGWKDYERLNNNEFKKKFSLKEIIIKNSINKICKLTIPSIINEIEFPSLFVSYKRNYYISIDNKIRITFDSNLNFGKMRNGTLIQNTIQNINYPFGVLEIKYAANQDNSEIKETLSNNFPLILTRFSKYCLGINSCY